MGTQSAGEGKIMNRNDLRHNPLGSPPALDEGYWLRRAKLTSEKAAMVQDPNLQQRLQRVAREYERLAGAAREAAGRPAGILV